MSVVPRSVGKGSNSTDLSERGSGGGEVDGERSRNRVSANLTIHWIGFHRHVQRSRGVSLLLADLDTSESRGGREDGVREATGVRLLDAFATGDGAGDDGEVRAAAVGLLGGDSLLTGVLESSIQGRRRRMMCGRGSEVRSYVFGSSRYHRDAHDRVPSGVRTFGDYPIQVLYCVQHRVPLGERDTVSDGIDT